MQGYIYNLIDIKLHIHHGDKISSISESLLNKEQFNEWLAKETNLEFINKIIDDNVVYSSWIVEFPNATKKDMKDLVKKLTAHPEVLSITYRKTILPKYDTLENRRKKQRAGIHYSF